MAESEVLDEWGYVIVPHESPIADETETHFFLFIHDEDHHHHHQLLPLPLPRELHCVDASQCRGPDRNDTVHDDDEVSASDDECEAPVR